MVVAGINQNEVVAIVIVRKVGVAVAIFKRRKYALVDWDYFRMPEENDPFLKDHAQELWSAIVLIHHEFANKKSMLDGSGLVGRMDNLLIDSADLAASKISTLFDHYVSVRNALWVQGET
ncbi:hypothetical protein WG219_09850 [Ectopseudomonas mendocina]|uniref:Fungal-type protein kinase domain-containing protein n=1 Tax=Ectopseudomonas mendocina TaxID=300 RepID=A0ABZ2RTW8_ECTME